MTSHSISYKKSVIHYLRAGSGAQLVFCFHGFGETAAVFSVLEPAGCTLIAIDLPFHGDTSWNEGPQVKPGDFFEILQHVLAQENRNAATFSLAGFSLGGRLALSLLEYQPEKIEKIILLAPDGIRWNFWYALATATTAGNRLFRYVIHHPGLLRKNVSALSKLKLINKGMSKFVAGHFTVEKTRKQLYDSWMGFRFFKPNISKIKKLIRQRNTSIRLIFGRYDRVISYKQGVQFARALPSHTHISIFNCGHHIITRERAAAIAEIMQS